MFAIKTLSNVSVCRWFASVCDTADMPSTRVWLRQLFAQPAIELPAVWKWRILLAENDFLLLQKYEIAERVCS